MNLRDFAPPVLFRLRRLRSAKTFASFEDAARVSGKGYNDDRLAFVVCGKTKRFRETLQRTPRTVDFQSLRAVLGVGLAATQSNLNVIDFGGGCGAHYFLVKSLLGARINLRWCVVETASMVSRGREMEDGSLSFHTDLQSAREALARIDLIYSSGALQYLPRPLDTLSQMIAIAPANIFLTRLGLSSSGDDLIVVQETRLRDNGPGALPPDIQDTAIKYPATFVAKQRFEKVLATDYDIELVMDEGVHPCGLRSNPVGSFGYFAKRKG